MSHLDGTADTFPRQYARTQRFTLGEPRTVQVSPDGRRVVFLRSRAGDDAMTGLWTLDVETGVERLVLDPHVLSVGDEALPAEERARRERAREAAGGITAYATDRDCTVVALALGGQLVVGGLLGGGCRLLDVPGPVFDPRPDPTARHVAYVRGRALCVAELDGRSTVLAGDDDPAVSWGLADFVAAEEMHRFRGFWWSPDGSSIAACRVDESPVATWHIADPAHPERPPTAVRYPAAGSANPDVTLHVLRLDGGHREVRWDRDALPYLADVRWTESALGHRLLLTVQSRDQRTLVVLEADPADGSTLERWRDVDEAWVELVPGTPAALADGRLVVAADRDGARRLLLDGAPITPSDLQVRAVAAVDADGIVFHGNPLDDATVLHVWLWRDGALTRLTNEPGVHTAASGGGTVVIRSATLEAERPHTVAHRAGRAVELTTMAQTPLVTPRADFATVGARRLATVVLLPTTGGDGPWPVLLDPYGGPHAQRVVRSRHALLTSQWFADQGFAVVIADGRGTPGRGSAWERAVHRDLAGPVLDDQVEALRAVADRHPLDLSRVGIRGWSFGGYLAALAVLRRPDVFHAAIAGAPVTEWRLYDTHYTERYLGDPDVDTEAYDGSSLLPLAPLLTRPLLLVHGLADDNVVAAHTLRLSDALLAAGRAHEVLPLVGVTHMTPQEVVAEHLLLHQLAFLRRSLGVAN